jgi:hypothetical protein
VGFPSDLARDAWDGTHKPLGELWSLTLGSSTLRCYLLTHYDGWQLRMELDGKVLRSQTCRTEFDVFDVSERLRKRAEINGWS